MARDHSVWLMMRDLVPGVYGAAGGKGSKHFSVAAVKDVWKWINGPLLAAKLKVHFDQNSLFEVCKVVAYVVEGNDPRLCMLHGMFSISY